ncbi:hypothetical protein ABPG77_010902 [Micractinium sp. CCAP 211/92]
MKVPAMMGHYRRWRDCERRRAQNEAGAVADALGWRLAAFWLAAFLVQRTWLREGRRGLALAGGTHSLLAFCLGWAAANRRRFYARHRELLLAVACLHVTGVSNMMGLLGSTNLFAHCRGSPLLLLFVALVKNGGLWVGFYSIFTRLDPAWNRAALPLLALPPLSMTRQLCGRMLEAPALELPLQQLYTALEAAHSAAFFPLPLLPPLERGGSAEQQCATVSAWSLLLSAVALPLLVLHWVGRRRLRLLAAHGRHHQEAAARPAATAVPGAALPEHPALEWEHRRQALQLHRQEQELRSWQPGRPWWLLELYLASCQLWSVATLLRPLLLR